MSAPLDYCEDIAQKIRELFTCSQVNQYILIRTPFLYPDGDVIDLFLKEEEEWATLTDLGETLRWLRMQTVRQKSLKQRQFIEDICLNHGIDLYRGMLMVRVKSPDDLAMAVIRLSQAAMGVADLWFTFRTQEVESITVELENLSRERQIHIEPLIADLKGQDSGVRFNAVLALRNISEKSVDTEFLQPAVEPLIDALVDQDASVRNFAVEALGKIGDKHGIDEAVAVMINDLKNPHPSIRMYAAEVLGKICDIRAVEPLIDALDDENPSVQTRAAEALKRIDDKHGIDETVRNISSWVLENSS